MPGTESAAMQPRGEIEAARDRVRSELEQFLTLSPQPPNPRATAYPRGELAAVKWVLGEESTSPLSGQAGVDVSDPRVIDSEWALSERMLRREIPMDRRGRSYVVGVEHALMWILHQTDNPL